MKTICDYICGLAEEAVRPSDLKKFKAAKLLLKNVENIIENHFIALTEDNRIFFKGNFNENEKELLEQFITKNN